jgi:enoyl-CoA hydratase/carnithine racemase
MSESVRLTIEGGIACVRIDRPGLKVNALSRAVLNELDEAIGVIDARGDELRGVLVGSGKPGQFVAGADLKEILRLAEQERGEIAGLVRLGHQVFRRLASLRLPTAALIDGPCLGGGLELALACDARIASAEPHTKLGLPEVKIGLIPSWGGTQRLPRLIDATAAARMVLSGEPLDAEEAVRRGLVDEACSATELDARGRAWIETLRASRGGLAPRAERSGVVSGMPERPPVARPNDEGEGPAHDAAWRALVEGSRVPLTEALALEEAVAVPLFLAEGTVGRVRAVLERRGRG